MGIEIEYVTSGVRYMLTDKKTKIDFPLESGGRTYKKLFKSTQWEVLQLLEQLWYQDIIQQEEEGCYHLASLNTYEMEEEDRQQLGLPGQQLALEVLEEGNTGSKKYSIYIDYLVGGLRVGRVTRKGNFVFVEQKGYWLTKEQYRLCEAIDKLQETTDVLERVRNLAKIKKLAQYAHANMGSFTRSRDFYLVDEVKVRCTCKDDHLIELEPELEDVPNPVLVKLEDNVNEMTQMYVDGVKVNVIFNEDTRKSFNDIKRNRNIEGVNVPKFLDNPISFIPESAQFDLEDFAKRVKGFKVYRSVAVPFVHLSASNEQVGWFDVDMGVHLTDLAEEESELCPRLIDDMDGFRKLAEEAKSQGEEYVYYNQQWIKIDPVQYEQFEKSKYQLQEQLQDNKISEVHLRTVLDIFENVEGIEYNETFLEKRSIFAKGPLNFKVSTLFKGILKAHQVEGYRFLSVQHEAKLGSLLADDMGLGKTVQVIAFMASLMEKGQLGPTLLVMPASLIDNWVGEFQQFLPNLKSIYIHQGTQRYKEPYIIEKYDVTLTTYETLARDQMILGKIRWELIVCDETQKIKNFKTLAAHAIKGMNTKQRIAMTGTPVENRLSELWSIVDFVQPGLLGSYAQFRKGYEVPIQENIQTSQLLAEELIQTIKPIFLRRTKEEVLSEELPTKSFHKLQMPLSQTQKHLYYELIHALKDEENNIMALSVIQKLIMICSHPRLLEETLEVPTKVLLQESPKLQYTMDLLGEIKRAGEKVIIFTTYKKMQSLLRRVIFDKFNIDAKIINGEIAKGRVQEVNRFNKTKGFNVLILSPKAAGVGLNITGANHVIHYTREWNPAIEAQATDRVYRMGQQRPVHVYYPICQSEGMTTVEEKLDLLLEQKMTLMKNVIVPTGLEITVEELKEDLCS